VTRVIKPRYANSGIDIKCAAAVERAFYANPKSRFVAVIVRDAHATGMGVIAAARRGFSANRGRNRNQIRDTRTIYIGILWTKGEVASARAALKVDGEIYAATRYFKLRRAAIQHPNRPAHVPVGTPCETGVRRTYGIKAGAQ
jgi:hypothetical protein